MDRKSQLLTPGRTTSGQEGKEIMVFLRKARAMGGGGVGSYKRSLPLSWARCGGGCFGGGGASRIGETGKKGNLPRSDIYLDQKGWVRGLCHLLEEKELKTMRRRIKHREKNE